MSVESKVKELLERVTAKSASSLDEAMGQPEQGDSKESPGAGPMVPTKGKDSTLKAANSGDSSQPRQGDSKDQSFETRQQYDDNHGAISAKGISKNDIQMKGPVGQAPNFTTSSTHSLSTIPQNTGNYMQHGEEVEEDENAEIVSEEEIQDDEDTVVEPIDLSPIFGEDLSEEFRDRATAIFEAAVIARVNSEMEAVAESLEEKYAEEFATYKEDLVEKIDAYLNYVVEGYLEENKLAIENGLRNEIAEDFMSGLKALFKEHYIEVPEEKYNVIGELQVKVTELEESLNGQIDSNVGLNSELTELKKKMIIKEMSKDLADTEVNKLSKLLEGVDFDNADLYKEKVSVIKENYFPRDAVVKASAKQALIEDTSTEVLSGGNDVVSTYAQALSRTIKRQ
jgi:hypothetical protein